MIVLDYGVDVPEVQWNVHRTNNEYIALYYKCRDTGVCCKMKKRNPKE